jgi:Ca2+-binding RTX toxin-like protein
MTGGAGNDNYFVTSLSDVVNESPNGGNDTVFALVNNYVLPANVEVGQIYTAGPITLTANATGSTLIGWTGPCTLIGGAGNDTLLGGSGVATMSGGQGNDSYFVTNVNDVINENAGGGTDTIYSLVSSYTLAANVENGQVLLTTGATLTGNASNGSLSGNAGNDTLIAGTGNETFAGAMGNDTFVFKDGFGHDTVLDFKANGDQDLIDLTGVSGIHTFSDVQSHAAQVGNDTVITINANSSITISNTLLSSLHQQDFLLA